VYLIVFFYFPEKEKSCHRINYSTFIEENEEQSVRISTSVQCDRG